MILLKVSVYFQFGLRLEWRYERPPGDLLISACRVCLVLPATCLTRGGFYVIGVVGRNGVLGAAV